MDPDSRMRPETGDVDGFDAGKKIETRPNSAVGIVLVSGGVAEIGKDSVAQVLREVAFIPRDHFGAGRLVASV
jgi:hypothetical protein